jgi:hypothetical protein
MTYSISYDAGCPSATKERHEEDLARIETFMTEHEALNRACRLLDDGEHHAISVCGQLRQRAVRCAPPTEVGFFHGIGGPSIQ